MSDELLPVYSFVEGDTLGLLLLARPTATVAELRELACKASDVRAAPPARAIVVHRGRELSPETTLAAAGIVALDRIDVRSSLR